jgi:hypothetical protein
MQRQQRTTRDPGRVPSDPKPNGFWSIPWDTVLKEGLCVCRACGALVINSDKSMALHKEYHR